MGFVDTHGHPTQPRLIGAFTGVGERLAARGPGLRASVIQSLN
jgi:hypothetical protein